MGDSSEKPRKPETTLVDPIDEAVAPTTVNPISALTPVGGQPTPAVLPTQVDLSQAQPAPGKRPTRSALPAQPPTPAMVTDVDTRLNPLAKGALDTETNPALPVPDAAASTSELPGLAPKPVDRLDEKQFLVVTALAAGSLALVVLVFIWVLVKFDDRPVDPGRATPIAGPRPQPPVAEAKPAEPAADVPKPMMIEQTLDAGGGAKRTVLAPAGTVRIVTVPEANVIVDRRDLGVSPVLVPLPAGKSEVVLENKKLLFRRTVSVEVVANEQNAVRFAFAKGWIELDAPEGSTVTIDGRPAIGNPVEVWEGTHKVEAVHHDKKKKKTREVRTVEVSAAMTTSVHFDAPSIADD